MIAMQYNIILPSDYDVNIIKRRIRDNGNKTDGFPGLKLKAYLIAEKGKYNNYENQYAPFYLWEQEDGMNKFLLDGYFNNILNSFGWTRVLNWVVLHEQVKKTVEPQYAAIQTISVPVYSDLTVIGNNEKEHFYKLKTDDSLTAYVAAYNPCSWEICHFLMATSPDLLKNSAKNSLIYDVHHIS